MNRRLEAMLDLWHDGRSSSQIATLLEYSSSAVVRAMIHRARHAGDIRAVPHAAHARTCVNAGAHTTRFIAEAGKRRVQPQALVSMLLERIVEDNLYSAVLDP